jgi:hypothetical protein
MADQTKPEKKATIHQTTTIVSHTRARVEQQVAYNHSEAGTVRLFVERLLPASIKNIPLLRAAKKPPTTQTFLPLQSLQVMGAGARTYITRRQRRSQYGNPSVGCAATAAACRWIAAAGESPAGGRFPRCLKPLVVECDVLLDKMPQLEQTNRATRNHTRPRCWNATSIRPRK